MVYQEVAKLVFIVLLVRLQLCNNQPIQDIIHWAVQVRKLHAVQARTLLAMLQAPVCLVQLDIILQLPLIQVLLQIAQLEIIAQHSLVHLLRALLVHIRQWQTYIQALVVLPVLQAYTAQVVVRLLMVTLTQANIPLEVHQLSMEEQLVLLDLIV